jgi:DNA-directed RNA polymerase subunit RPC12/RpoP
MGMADECANCGGPLNAEPEVPEVAAATAPLTCERCRSAPAVRLVVVDLPNRDERLKSLACPRCAEAYAREAADLGWPMWQFGLESAGEEAATAAGGEQG